MSADGTAPGPGSGSTPDPAGSGRPPLLPHAGAANPALDRLVRENLRRLAEVTEDPVG